MSKIDGVNMKILDHIPEGWRVVIGAINAPNGYRYINNNKSRFCGEYQSALVPENIVAKGKHEQMPLPEVCNDKRASD